MCVVRKSVAKSLLAVGIVLASCAWSTAWAQRPESRQRTETLVLLQGREVKLPEDFVARLDGNRLKIALKSFGLAERHPDRDLLVSLIQDDGTSTEAQVDDSGEAVFENVKEGLASIVVPSGSAAYAAMAIYAVPGVENNPAKTFEVPVATVDEREVRSGVESAGTAPVGNAASQLSDFQSGVVNRFQVYLQPDGNLIGRVIVPEVGFEQSPGAVSLSFYRDGALAGRTMSTDDGSFSIAGLQPGVHSVFASGPPGHAAFAFEILPPKGNELPFSGTPAAARTRLVAARLLQAEPANELIVLLIPPRLMAAVRDTVNARYPLNATVAEGLAGPVAGPLAPGAPLGGFPGFGGLPGGGFAGGGGFGGGGGFAGGGGGGLGGIGGLLGIAGLAVGVTALADEDDGFDGNMATQIAP